MLVFRAISSKNRWAIKSGLRSSEPIGVPTALTDVEGSCRLGLTSAVGGQTRYASAMLPTNCGSGSVVRVHPAVPAKLLKYWTLSVSHAGRC
jgi:hypothetical protein